MDQVFDTAIIGTGAAGVSAALTLKARKKNFIWFGSAIFSEKIRKAEMIHNYPGLSMINGTQFKEALYKQVQDENLTITEKTVTAVLNMGNTYAVACNRDIYRAKTIILATGVEAVNPIPGELEFVGRGVSYCATCDGMVYKDKTIAVLCTTKELEHEIEYLADLAKQVYLFPLYKPVKVKADNITILNEKMLAVHGSKKVEQISSDNGFITVEGVFMLKKAVSPSILVPGIVAVDGHIVVDRSMQTNLKGVFAAGDCTGAPYQYAKAVGEGNVAAHSVVQYLNKAV